MHERLAPVEVVSDAALAAGKRALIWDAAWASITGAWSGGVVLVAFALSQGAGPMTIGLLASIPFIAQIAQLPTILLVERFRRRKMIGVGVLTVARIVILALAFLPFIDNSRLTLGLLLASQLVIAVLGSVGACAINSWFHQLLPAASLGSFFGKRLLVAAGLACGATLSIGLLIDGVAPGATRYAYALAFLGAGVAGLLSSYCLMRTPEPLMPARTLQVRLRSQLAAPFRDLNFRRLLFMLGGWSMASNIAAPFLTVYLIEQLHYELGTVTGMWVASQLANAAALYLWGRLSDRMPNKAILAVAFPLYFACTLGLVFADAGDSNNLQLVLFYLLHVVMGMASGGIGLATGNMGLKFAPQGQGTAYLAAIGLVSAGAGGLAPLLGGSLAQLFSESQLSLVVRWNSSLLVQEVVVLGFAHWEFLFALSAVLGLYVMHALSRVAEGEEVSERVVVQELALEALRTVNHLSTLGGVIGTAFSFARVSQWRRELRKKERS